MRERGALFGTNGLILLFEDPLQLFSRSRVAMLDAVLQHMPNILDRVEVWRARRELHNVHAMVVHPRVNCSGVVWTGIVLLETPEAMREETLIAGLEVVLQDIAVEL